MEVWRAMVAQVAAGDRAGLDALYRFAARRFFGLALVRFFGTVAQQEEALSVLNALVAGNDGILAEAAAWSRTTRRPPSSWRLSLPC